MSSPATPSSAPTSSLKQLKGCINIALSVDGFIAGKDGDIDWLNNQPQIEGEDFGFMAFLDSMSAMIMGRTTFDTVVGFGKEMYPYGDLPIYVWTRNPENVKIPDWIPKTVTVTSHSSPRALWEELSEKYVNNSGGGNIYIDGGKTIQLFLKAGLVHRLSLSRIPILLGEGVPLFGGGNNDIGVFDRQVPLRHDSTKAYQNGFVVSTYDVIYETTSSKTEADKEL